MVVQTNIIMVMVVTDANIRLVMMSLLSNYLFFITVFPHSKKHKNKLMGMNIIMIVQILSS